ncbi:DHA2 family efflux MFS transporter permease subunit [Actinomadura madurae]|nr:DHA2 family efflux MFS transporter permease subunit [Actinomadura madurae]
MVALDATVVTTALSRIRLDLGTSMEQLEWTVNAYSLSFAVLLMTGAVLGDRFGRRLVFTAGLALFTAASAACALAPDVGWLIAARAVQGTGAALVMPLAMALLSAAYPPPDRPKALGLFAGLTGLAVVGGPVIGGAVTQGLAWEWIFWLNLPIGLVVVPLVLRRVPESRGGGRAVDAAGLVLVTGAALGLVWGLVRSQAAGWGSAEVAGSLIAGVVCGAAFVAWERVARQPMVPLELFRLRGFAAGNAAGVFLYAALYGSLFFAAQYFQTGRGDRPLAAGLHLLAWTASVTVVAPVAGRLVNRVGARPPAAAGLALQAAGMGWLALAATPSVPYWQLVAPMLVARRGREHGDARHPDGRAQRGRAAADRERLRRVQHRAAAGRGVRRRPAGPGVRPGRELRGAGRLRRRVRRGDRGQRRAVARRGAGGTGHPGPPEGRAHRGRAGARAEPLTRPPLRAPGGRWRCGTPPRGRRRRDRRRGSRPAAGSGPCTRPRAARG